ncbi:MAG: hypothetical protein H6550_06015 [Chitinophagales bacterium]|nr:hypothetical protein [Chitinophagales bacterium]
MSDRKEKRNMGANKLMLKGRNKNDRIKIMTSMDSTFFIEQKIAGQFRPANKIAIILN